MDYLILSYTFYINRIIPPHIAAGVNLSFFPLGNIFRHSGAFFLRRTFKNLKMYPIIFKQYLKTLVMDRYQIEFFIEGGRTRTGRLLKPKPGLLSFLIEAVEEGYAEDLTIIPISINYDRVLEEKSYHGEVKGKAKKRENVAGVLSGRKFLKKDYGYVYVSAGKPLSLNEMKGKVKSDRLVPYIGERIMLEIGEAVTVSPVAFITLAILMQQHRGFMEEDVLSTARYLYDYAKLQNVDFADIFQSSSLKQIFHNVLNNYIADGFVERLDSEGIYHILNDNRRMISFYKNSIAHFFLPLCICAGCIVRNDQKDYARSNLLNDYIELYTFLSNEFVLDEIDETKAEAQIKDVIDSFLVPAGFLQEGTLKITDDEEKSRHLTVIAKGIQDVIESYYITCDTLVRMKQKKMKDNELMKRIREHANALELTDKITFVESVSVPVFKNALRFLRKSSIIEEKSISKRRTRISIIDKEALQEQHRKIQSYILYAK